MDFFGAALGISTCITTLKSTVILIRLFENSSSLNISYENIQQWHANYLVKQTIDL